MSPVAPWDRLMWAVEMRSKTDKLKGMLISAAWHNQLVLPRYPGEPTRALLFCTRLQAREFCAAATAKHAKRGADWRFRPVRVRETVAKKEGRDSGYHPRKNAD